MPAPARNRGHRLAAYRRCSADPVWHEAATAGRASRMYRAGVTGVVLSLTGPGPDDPPCGAEVAGFRRLRQRRIMFWSLFAAFVPIAGGAILLGSRIGLVLGIGWAIAVGASDALLAWSRCPRCSGPCFSYGLRHNVWAERCASCGVRLYWPPERLRTITDVRVGAGR